MPWHQPYALLVLSTLALPAQEAKVEAKDPALDLIRGMLKEAEAARAEGENEDAREALREAVKACLELAGLAERKDAHDLLFDVGRAAHEHGDLATAHDAWQRVCDYRTRTLPDDHPDLQVARRNLANIKFDLGDLTGACALYEKIHEVLSRTLPDDHFELQMARMNLAGTKLDLGDLASAHALMSRVYEVCSRTLPDDHPDLQKVRANLSSIKDELGDHVGARVLLEKAYEVESRTLPDDDPGLQMTRANLAVNKLLRGDDFTGARVLLEKVCEVYGRTLPDEHPYLQLARQMLVAASYWQRNLAEALALQEKVIEVLGRTLPDDHPYLQEARTNLAVVQRELGDLTAARALQEKVYEVYDHTLPDDADEVQRARSNLAWTHAHAGNGADATALAVERGSIALQRLSTWALAPRELGAMAAHEQDALDLVLTLAGGFGKVGAQVEITGDALALSQALRNLQTRAARASRRARAADPERMHELEIELRAAAAEVSRVAGQAPEGESQGLEANRRVRVERLTRAVHDKERIERDLVALAAKAGNVATAKTSAADLAAALPERSAAAAIVGFKHSAPDPEHPGGTIDEARLAALVLARDGSIAFQPLGARAEIDDLVATLRAQVGAGRDRGLSPKESEDPLAVQKALRARVLDPILAAAGDVDTLWLSVDEALELVPLDALAGDDGAPLGAKIALRPLVALFELLEPPGVEVADKPSLLAIGGLDYDEASKDAVAVLGEAATPVTEDTRSGRPSSFSVLLDSREEVRKIAHYFGETFADGATHLVTGKDAGKAMLTKAAPQATFVHLATHGYFAPESVKSVADVTETRDSFGETAITGLSPLALCGLALSGANLPPDDLGRHAGILTAEEILSLDLSHCYLVTLSACDTSLGVRRAGQGYASLRAALQGAGARYVLTSLWKVGDEATMELMVDFYRRLWVQKKEPHTALWEAKMAARQKGAPFRDWAGWVLTGR